MIVIMGILVCYVVFGFQFKEVFGMFGVVDGGIVDGLWGFEVGQMVVGDIFVWFIDNCVLGLYFDEVDYRGIGVYDLFIEKCVRQEVGVYGFIVLDWYNGNWLVFVDVNLLGMILGQIFMIIFEDQYWVLLELIVFGVCIIIELFWDFGVEINELVVVGGLMKNIFFMQLFCDIC